MKLVINEKLKHRLVGVSVILSLGAIFLPAMMKKSSQRLEHNFSVNVQLPPKPAAPKVAMTDEEQMFKTIKIARAVDISSSENNTTNSDVIVSAAADAVGTTVAQLDSPPESQVMPLEMALNEVATKAVKKEIIVAAKKPVKAAVIAAKAQKPVVAKAVKPAVKQEIYALQLASFSKLTNAQSLVSKLQSKGYKANYVSGRGKNGMIYKVYVGHSPIKSNVVKLRSQLASAMQLNGFVVNTGVS